MFESFDCKPEGGTLRDPVDAGAAAAQRPGGPRHRAPAVLRGPAVAVQRQEVQLPAQGQRAQQVRAAGHRRQPPRHAVDVRPKRAAAPLTGGAPADERCEACAARAPAHTPGLAGGALAGARPRLPGDHAPRGPPGPPAGRPAGRGRPAADRAAARRARGGGPGAHVGGLPALGRPGGRRRLLRRHDPARRARGVHPRRRLRPRPPGAGPHRLRPLHAARLPGGRPGAAAARCRWRARSSTTTWAASSRPWWWPCTTPPQGTLTYASAGHPAPLVAGPSRPEAIVAASSPPVGLGLRTGVRQTVLPLPPGSVVCLYTDGLAEARTERGVLGRPRLGDILAEMGREATRGPDAGSRVGRGHPGQRRHGDDGPGAHRRGDHRPAACRAARGRGAGGRAGAGRPLPGRVRAGTGRSPRR